MSEQEMTEGMEEEQFDAGFELAGDESLNTEADAGQNQESENSQESGEPQQGESAAQPEPILPVNEQAGQPEDRAGQSPAQKGQLEAPPENIAQEWENLNRLNPAAAKLALEDSQEGEAIRRRLENYGAEQAQDRAEMTLYRRNQEQAAIDAHNRRFQETIRRNNPEYFALISDPARKAEAAQYFNSVFQWIEQKPYAEAQSLMAIARTGRDPEQICALINRFEQEKGATAKKPDATGAYAVPSRGAPVPPTGVGDKDDFDAGWDLNQ